ncbi:hydrogenase formation protein HypD [Desulfoscipio gibsoniae]|uniref:Hydrogenase expression/formation protein HypD n=1 Tax=Desulfoscipio gibsoniae DSM 7213 TaxID=767817 RepID=R4KJJ5_9FIRM|nr:hydrogenase formation protein HypD [Desulfoscipio gibsoniae]AGL00695.1 hydrogenase expression/formation protein HypD [Desulfoscipio gibsoniae DSM 7213]
MSVLKKLNDPQLGRQMVKIVKEQAARVAERLGRAVRLMEVCGTHTMAISSTGLRGLLSGLMELRSGPGCPVCVTAAGDIEQMIAISRVPGVTVATFGDMVRVPGVLSSLERERARGARVQIVYSPADAVALARDNPAREVVFLGVGFETTAPLAALSINEAAQLGLSNFSVYSIHKLVPPVMRALLGAGEARVDGLILPGHVCAVTGSKAFAFIGEEYGIPAVVTGFTMVDILDALHVLLNKMQTGDSRVVNGYRWVVRDEGNLQAQGAIKDCFYPGDAIWRGFGVINNSGLFIKEHLARYDAMRKFGLDTLERVGGLDLPMPEVDSVGGAGQCASCNESPRDPMGSLSVAGGFVSDGGAVTQPVGIAGGKMEAVGNRFTVDDAAEPRGCRCGELLRGIITPPDCALFGRKCTPASPVGPCMVSSEGACAAYYRYGATTTLVPGVERLKG